MPVTVAVDSHAPLFTRGPAKWKEIIAEKHDTLR